MQTKSYVISIRAIGPHGETIADYHQEITQQALRDNRPTRMKDFINGVVERFLYGHRGIEKALPKPRRRKPMKMRAAIPFDPMNREITTHD